MTKFNDKFVNVLYDFWLNNAEDICSYCRYNKPCKAGECEKFIDFETDELEDEKGNKYKYSKSLTCLDLNFGDCPLLENTPCHDCDFKDTFKLKDEFIS